MTRTVADFDEPEDPEIQRLLISLGRAVTATAALEQALQMYALAEVTEIYPLTDPQFAEEMTRLLRLTGGQVCSRLRTLGLGLPKHLEGPIEDAIGRRNALMHRSFRDLELARAAFANERVDPIVTRMDQLARDCAGLMFDLERTAVPKLCSSIGLSPEDMLKVIGSIDLGAAATPQERREFADLTHLLGIEGLAAAVSELSHFAETAEPSAGPGE